jgi:tRNA threonylcarbamoyladenosine biosynthesis protein TsaE
MNTTLPHPERRRLRLPPDAASTEELGAAIGRRLRAGDVLALVGELGSGKTTLVRGLARGLGIDDPDAVASPTYLLVVEHAGRVPLLHADAYLPAKLAAFLADGGLDYLFQPGVVSVVEWADRVAAAVPSSALWLQLVVAPDGGRTVALACARAAAFAWLGELGG